VLREGSLQEKPGPSIATEFGILLPGIHDERGTGASLAGIVSQQWNWVAVHFNAAATLAREQHADIALDAVVEGPHDWAVRPVVAFFHERNFGQFQTRSTLFGVIREVQDNLAVDFGLRGARANDHTAGEIAPG
jgi:hypothetical protein